LNRKTKRTLLEHFGRIGKALAAPVRLEILDVLTQAPRTVEVLANETHASVANTSRHLQVLRAAGLVEATRDGLFVTYRIASPRVTELTLALRAVAAERLGDLERARREYLGAPEPVTETSARELARRVKRGEVLLLDVRPAEEYATAHLPGAISVPVGELETALARLPRSKEMVAYCRGPYCAYASEAVRFLRARKYKATRLEEGVHEWRARGLPVEEAPP
jgi:rhodanese-related sulfurtransferase/DNA-binding transcriptional ArsR family regulator